MSTNGGTWGHQGGPPLFLRTQARFAQLISVTSSILLPRMANYTFQGVRIELPSETRQPQEIFDELGRAFRWPQVVTSHLYTEVGQGGLGMETLGDFLASGADDCDSMLQEVVDTNPQLKQEVEKVHARARASQAWLALRAARSQAAALQKKDEPHDDLDAICPKTR